jgi:hypothetical protein
MGGQCHWVSGLLIGSILTGCSRAPESTPGTGAKECVQAYFEALIRQDWASAYAALDIQSHKRCSIQQFGVLARTYHGGLGFEPTEILVRTCEERGEDASAHVVLTGQTATNDRRYKDAVTLRRGDDGWRVILPPNFGRSKKK